MEPNILDLARKTLDRHDAVPAWQRERKAAYSRTVRRLLGVKTLREARAILNAE